MKTFYRYAALVAGSLLGLCACSSDDDVADTSGKTPVAQPQVIVSELTTTGFKIRWEAVEGAGAYVYTFNGSEETSTDACQLSFGDLERQKNMSSQSRQPRNSRMKIRNRPIPTST